VLVEKHLHSIEEMLSDSEKDVLDRTPKQELAPTSRAILKMLLDAWGKKVVQHGKTHKGKTFIEVTKAEHYVKWALGRKEAYSEGHTQLASYFAAITLWKKLQ
jgi:hypothetical protein